MLHVYYQGHIQNYISVHICITVYYQWVQYKPYNAHGYPTVCAVFVFSFAALIASIGRIVPNNSLFCSHSDLLHTMTDSPTPFCVISGKQTHLY